MGTSKAKLVVAALIVLFCSVVEKESKLKKRPLELKEAWLSRAALLTRYGPKHQ